MLDLEWQRAIAGFLTHERAGGKRSETIRIRRAHLEHFARRTPREPWRVNGEDLVDYFASREWAPEHAEGVGRRS